MSEPFLGEIKMFGGNFAPAGYAMANGQLMAIAQNSALFSLYGTTYGGDGRTTFALPDMRGRLPIHTGSGAGLRSWTQGEQYGTETATVDVSQLAGHNHAAVGLSTPADKMRPSNQYPARSVGAAQYRTGSPSLVAIDDRAVEDTGGGAAHANVMPFLAVTFIVRLVGIFPSRN